MSKDVRHFSKEPPKGSLSWIFTLASLGLLVGFVVWASIAEVEEVTRGDGRIVPSSRIQIVQSLEGGLLSELLVEEGQRVNEGQLLLQIDDTQFAASAEEVNAKQAALVGKISRLEAEMAEKNKIVFPAGFEQTHSDIAASESQLFWARRNSVSGEINTLRARAEQGRQERAELQATERQIINELSLIDDEISLNAKVADIVPEAERLRLRKEREILRGELEVSRSGQSRANAAISETQSQIRQVRSAFRAEAQAMLTDSQGELSVINASFKSADDRLVRSGLRSPVNGIVNAIYVTTTGGVISPGEPLVEIVPEGDKLQIEARIRPQDIAFLTPNQQARVTITAYDYSIYGGLDGHVQRIGADSLTDEVTGEAYFPIDIIADAASFKKDNETLPISPGMVASVDIITGEKTVLEYLLKPVKKAKFEALKER